MTAESPPPAGSGEHLLVVPSDIPWPTLKDEELEHLLYWLLDAMGAKDLTWRAGGRTANAPDGGRDIEVTMHVMSTEAVPEPSVWWVEAKGRAAVVEKEAVTAAATNALAYPVDVLIVATNARFTNPTRDWVAAFNQTHARPRVELWDRHELERLVVRHPLVAARVLPDILSPEGRLALHLERFWQRRDLLIESDLNFFWEHKETVVAEPGSLLPILISEVDHGDLSARPWLALDLPIDAIAHVLAISLANLLSLSDFDNRRGLASSLLVRTAAAIVQAALVRLATDSVIAICSNPWQFADPNIDPNDALMRLFMDPVSEEARYTIARSCTADCSRVIVDFPDDLHPEDHWKLFFNSGEVRDRDARYLIIEAREQPCTIGLKTGDDWVCPLFAHHDGWKQVLAALGPVLDARISRALCDLDCSS